jgi:acyl carrier protein
MMDAELECKVIEIIAKQLSVAKATVKRESRIQEDLGADSLDTVEMVMELEDGLDIEIQDQALEKMKTVGDVMDYAQSEIEKAKKA